ncbi:phosphate:acyl-[acyl carrier protein] acyltransferase [Keratinibaculum paraultunense]|uniref:Phosphate acyltransferase n=1 Tax=Keratinibaculum paraultunense TaxID=1278232 RepID=A0A4V6NZ52_9FIRM|nr:phosphate acyltransferase PlsX [Keratinibaculum paraultunense]QQY80764.1 phosphate acyltransferase PlsX [Keratinibaculum paraultunense]TCS89625.1 phosphate:acyl-[acyl carrier protein] acyltransferase [Keratinibaculum paraultunense]
MRIIVDSIGGDKGPGEIIKGCVEAVNELDINITIVGKEDEIKEELSGYNFSKDSIDILNAKDMITNEDDPALAIRRKKDSSMVVGLKALAEGYGDAFVSTGNTGALLAGGLFIVKRIEGIERAALATVYPTRKGFSLMLDIGANVDCKPEYLKQFAIMGSIYSEKVLGIKSPKVGLANIGVEEVKGNNLVRESYKLLKDANINFCGNAEVRDIPEGVMDVIVCDGFIGNVILKLTEGMAITMFSILEEEFTKSFKSKIGAMMLKPQFKSLKNRLDYREYGGAPLLGLKQLVVKAHGSSDAIAIKNAIKQAKTFVDKDVIKIIESEINILEK